MGIVRDILTRNRNDYENLIKIVYQIAEVTEINLDHVVAKLDDLYDMGE